MNSPGDRYGYPNPPKKTGHNHRPLELRLDVIDEDPNQPRKVFDPDSLAEMAATIRTRGVKTPISVRPNLEVAGRYLINHGARRYRASKLADKTSIPAFIDADYTEADQVIENLQRDGLTPREIADFIGRERAKGMKKSDIAKAIGKSPAFVTQHVTLLDLPDPIAKVFNTGVLKDVTVINELVTAYKKNPEEVTAWLADDSQELTRGSVKLLREFLDDKRRHEQAGEGHSDTVDGFPHPSDAESEEDEHDTDTKKNEPRELDPYKLKKTIVQVQHSGRAARLILNRRPPAVGYAWLKYEDDGQELKVDLAQVKLVAILEG